jgi:hypothetical protein
MFLCTAWVEQRNCTAAWRRVVAIPGGARPHQRKHTPQHGHRPKKVLEGRGGGVYECECVCGVLGGGRLLGGGGGRETRHGSSGRVNGPGPWAWRCLPLWPHRAAAVTAGKVLRCYTCGYRVHLPCPSHHNLAEPQCRTGYVPPPFPSFAFVSHLGSFGSPLAPSHRIPEYWRGEALSFILPYPSAPKSIDNYYEPYNTT